MIKQLKMGKIFWFTIPAVIALSAMTAFIEPAVAKCQLGCRQAQDRQICRQLMDKQSLKGDKRKSEYDRCMLDPAAYGQSH
jgi:hypothetical protein